MKLTAITTVFMLVIIVAFVLGFFALTIALQVWLCKKSNVLGLILPIISILQFLMLLLNMVAIVGAMWTAILLMLLFGIPAGVYWGIWYRYYKISKQRVRQDDLKRMSIEDLE